MYPVHLIGDVTVDVLWRLNETATKGKLLRSNLEFRGGCPLLENPLLLAGGPVLVPQTRARRDPYLWVELMAGLMRARPLLVPSLMTTRPNFLLPCLNTL